MKKALYPFSQRDFVFFKYAAKFSCKIVFGKKANKLIGCSCIGRFIVIYLKEKKRLSKPIDIEMVRPSVRDAITIVIDCFIPNFKSLHSQSTRMEEKKLDIIRQISLSINIWLNVGVGLFCASIRALHCRLRSVELALNPNEFVFFCFVI